MYIKYEYYSFRRLWYSKYPKEKLGSLVSVANSVLLVFLSRDNIVPFLLSALAKLVECRRELDDLGLTSGISTRTTVLHTLVHLVALSLSAINHSYIYIYIDVYIEKSFKSSKFSAASAFEMGGAMLRPTSWPENRSHRRFARRIRVSS